MGRPVIKKSIEILTIIILAVLLSELAFRLYNKLNPTFILPEQNYNLFRGKPFSKDCNFFLNSKGLKDTEYTKEKPSHVYRILAIGDSFVYGVVPYQYNFLTTLEEKLNLNNNKVEIINMGIPRTGVDSYCSLLINEGLNLNPDQIICFFTIGNDFVDSEYKRHELYLFSFFKYLFKVRSHNKKDIMQEDCVYLDDESTFSIDKFMEILRIRSWLFTKNREPSNELWPLVTKYVFSYIRTMKEICDNRKIKFLLVIIPEEIQIDNNLQNDFCSRFKELYLEDLDFTLPNKTLSTLLEKFNIEYIDLLNDFAIASKNQRLYKPNDTHWNIAGNELASNLIYGKIKELAEESK